MMKIELSEDQAMELLRLARAETRRLEQRAGAMSDARIKLKIAVVRSAGDGLVAAFERAEGG